LKKAINTSNTLDFSSNDTLNKSATTSQSTFGNSQLGTSSFNTHSMTTNVVTQVAPPPPKHNILRKSATSYSEVKANSQTTISNHATSLNLEEKDNNLFQATSELNMNKHIDDPTGH